MKKTKQKDTQSTTVTISNAPPGFFDALCFSLDPAGRSTDRYAGISRRVAFIGLSLLLLLLWLAFARTPFHIDDPLFIWAAQHIQTNPSNPYGFMVNWYGASASMAEITKNPPLTSYYIALMALLLGWSEPALHLIFIAAAIAVAIGTYLIAEKFCSHPLLATLAAVLTPVFFVSSLTVMSDVLMLAFWVFAVYFWLKGIETSQASSLVAGAVLIGACSLTKYFGMTLIPLLLMYSIFRKRAVGVWTLCLAIPVAVLASYQWITHFLYGRGLLLDAAGYATEMRTDLAMFPLAKTYVACSFTGACIATVLFFAWQLWSRAAIVGGAFFILAMTVLFFNASDLGSFAFPQDETTHVLMAIQLSVWGTAGISLILLAALDLYDHRDPESLFLFAWVIGTFLFAGLVNWTTNGRSILPMTIPAGIVIIRRMEKRSKISKRATWPGAVAALALSLAVSFAVSWADAAFAETGRAAAARINDLSDKPQAVWFQGHWGFQYYMEKIGAKPIDFNHFRPSFGDIVVVPTTNTNLLPLPPACRHKQTIDVADASWISTMNYKAGAGFYADVFGPLPFAVGRILPERFDIFEVKP
jgi:4-amino-4-deoxy-L-arabinose transferase-like glycosyltransferase